MALSKVDGSVSYAYCQCPAGKVGTCSHMFAVMKLVAKWAIDKLTIIPEIKACTSKPCTWSVPQSRGKLFKSPISEISLISPASKKQKTIDENATPKGIKSSLYDARIGSQRVLNDSKVDEMFDFLSKEKPNIHALQVLNKSEKTFVETKFGMMPVGSALSYQCSLIPADFNIYSNLPVVKECDFNYLQFPDFPFSNTENNIQSYIDQIKDAGKVSILNNLKLNNDKVVSKESSTRNQANDPEWFKHRKNRFTASLCNRLGSNGPKTSKGFKTLAHNIIHGNEKQKSNKIIQFKLSYGRYHEPIAIKHYESYAKLKGHKTVVEPCGLVINSENFILGATPDGKVVFDGEFGIIEVKCSEEYSNVDPKDICFISKNFCLVFDEVTEKIHINKNHTYYDQIQMQLALTTQTWCNFVFYTSKGLVIDRVFYDEEHWGKLQKSILDFYFHYMLDEIVTA